MSDYKKRTETILERINELASISEDGNFICRTFGSDAFIKASTKLRSWMNEAGLTTHIDNVGNVRGKLDSTEKGCRKFVIGSHIDTVKDAGKFDGTLGVLMGLDLLENIRKTGPVLPFDIELIAFSDEEGVRFLTSYLGSKVVVGSFDKDLLERKDDAGITLRQVIESMGGDTGKLTDDAISKENWLGYYEIHIEQGPVLYHKNIPAASVKAIAGQRRVEVKFQGVQGHAGTVPMDMRKDALCGVAEFILNVEAFANENRRNMVATVGKVYITNAAGNVIPGEVSCTLDLRSDDEGILVSSHEHLRDICKKICDERELFFQWNLVQQSGPVECDKEMNRLLALSIQDAGYDCISLTSGAGHDAVAVSRVAPVAMLFVRCFEGISHHPAENVESKDIEAAILISDLFIQYLIKKYNPQ